MRRFVNLVSQKWCGRVDSSSIYSLHRLDVADHLFYPSTADAEKAKAEAANKEDGGAAWPPSIQRLRQLPAPTMTFQAASRALQVDADVRFFALLSPRDSEGRILLSNKLGHSILYDADANCVTAMPVLAGQLGCHPITISLARPGSPDPELQDLYVMHSAASTDWDTCCFGVLRFGDLGRKAWCWEPLPAPPLGPCTHICSHAVVDGGRAICVSAQSVPGYGPSPATDGTYCFDTMKREWKRAGDWILPFEGGAEHVLVPGLGDLWLGFANDGRNLCAASGLSAAVSMETETETETAPALQHVWRDACKVPGTWRPTCPQLVDLGGGRFCIAKTCTVMPDAEYDEYSGPGIEVAVLSGVELLTGGGGDRPPGSIDIVEHKSLGYICRSDSISWVM